MNAIDLIAAKAADTARKGFFDEGSSEPPPSPCISVCRMSEDRSHCLGCFRTLDELTQWSAADAPTRRAIWARLLQRAGLSLA